MQVITDRCLHSRLSVRPESFEDYIERLTSYATE